MADKSYKLTFELSDGSKKELELISPQGPAGPEGEAGYTPVKGKDYWTEEDQTAIQDECNSYIAEELAKRGQLAPKYANSIKECTDTTKLYVLPDGFIYAYTKITSAGGEPLFTNKADPSSSDWKTDTRFSSSSGSMSTLAGAIVTNAIAAKRGDVIRIKGITDGTGSLSSALFQLVGYKTEAADTSFHRGFLFKKNVSSIVTGVAGIVSVENDITTYNLFEYTTDDTTAIQYPNSQQDYDSVVAVRVGGVPVGSVDDIIITINEEITYSEATEGYAWSNTGHAFVPADYEERIVSLEVEVEEGNEKITDIQNKINSGARWYALGDSITEGWTSAVDESADTGYKQYLNTTVAERWVNIVAEMNGYELTNHGVGGTGYLQGTNNARVLVDTIDFSQCDFVTLAYGVNDWKYAVNIGSMDDDIETGGSMVSNMRYVIQKILTDNPLCKIFVITPINCRSLGTYATNWGINYAGDAANNLGLEDIFELQKAVCEYHGIELIDMTHCSVINRENIKTLLADNVHPTAECHKMLARELAQKIHFR